MQHVMSDGRASLALDFYLGRTEAPVYDDDGNPGKTGADWDSAPEQTGTLLMLQS